MSLYISSSLSLLVYHLLNYLKTTTNGPQNPQAYQKHDAGTDSHCTFNLFIPPLLPFL